MIEFVSGDLLQVEAAYIGQGVAEGSQEGLGTGLALKISKKWPEAQSAFKKHTRGGRFKGGEIFVVPPSETRPGIVYIATQPDMYHATIQYLRKGLRSLVRWADANGVESVALPKIGAGLGKLSWEDEVRPMLVEILTASSCRFVVIEEFQLEFESPSASRA